MWTLYGLASREAGDIANARSALEQAIRLGADDARTYGELAWILLVQSEPALGLPYFEKALGKVEGAVLRSWVGSLVGDCHDRLGDPETAAAYYRTALQEDETNAHAAFGLAGVLWARGQYIEATEMFRKAAVGNPEDAQTLYWLGVSLNRLGDHGGARQPLEQALRLGFDPVLAHRQLAHALYRRGELEGAREHATEALSAAFDTSMRSQLHSLLGDIERQGGALDRAHAHLTQALDMDPANLDALYNLALLHLASDDLPEATAALNRLLAIDPEYEHAVALARDLEGGAWGGGASAEGP